MTGIVLDALLLSVKGHEGHRSHSWLNKDSHIILSRSYLVAVKDMYIKPHFAVFQDPLLSFSCCTKCETNEKPIFVICTTQSILNELSDGILERKYIASSFKFWQ